MTKRNNTLVESPWWYKQVPRDFMSSPDVTMMTAEEIGTYFLLLQCEWLGGQDCTLPNDPERLAKLTRVAKVSDIVLSKFQQDKDGRLFNPRLMEEWKQALNRSKDSIKANKIRWENGIRSESGGNAPRIRGQSEQQQHKEQHQDQQNQNHFASASSSYFFRF
jgi:uncharacterized protein YdaU (DUF1376 family)